MLQAKQHTMKQLTINIPDNLYASVVELFKHIPKVTIQEEADFEIPEWQKKIVRERIKNAKPENFKSYSEVRKIMKKKHGI